MTQVRNAVIAFITVIAILIIGFGTYVSTPLGQSEIDASADYREVPKPRERRPGEPIEVVEFFSYTCIHCKNFDPVIEDWAEDQPEGVVFKRTPAMFSPIQTMLGRAYLTLEAADALDANHMRIFRALHDSNRQFLTPEMVADYVDGRDITKEAFLEVYESPDVRRATRDAERAMRDFQVSATPSMLVGGRYMVSMRGGENHALRVVEHLIEKIQSEDAASPQT